MKVKKNHKEVLSPRGEGGVSASMECGIFVHGTVEAKVIAVHPVGLGVKSP